MEACCSGPRPYVVSRTPSAIPRFDRVGEFRGCPPYARHDRRGKTSRLTLPYTARSILSPWAMGCYESVRSPPEAA
jgi:hypothetical protein